MIRRLLAIAVLLVASTAHAWSTGAHHIVALLAYDLLDEADQGRLLELLAEHPRYAEDFNPPKKIRDVTRWRVGRAGDWPDVARSQPKYNRPTWHYQLAATKVIGRRADLDIPETPGPLPAAATLETKELHIAQAIELCTRVMADAKAPAGDRAIALCWLAHLAGDSHMPCHAGSLYAAGVFPKGDRGANEIELLNGRNLHAVWDGLLGRQFDEGDVERRLLKLRRDGELMKVAQFGVKMTDPMQWLTGSRQIARDAAYTPEVVTPIRAVSEGKMADLPPLRLSDEYLATAGRIAQLQVATAGYRLGVLWRRGLRAAEEP